MKWWHFALIVVALLLYRYRSALWTFAGMAGQSIKSRTMTATPFPRPSGAQP